MLAGQHISQLVARDALHIRRFVAGIQCALQLGVGRLLGGYLLRQVLQLLALGNGILCPWEAIAISTLVSDMLDRKSVV